MGKRKINTLRGKRLVTGNPNLITMNEIHVKDTQKGIEVTERDKNGKLVNVNVPQSGGGESGGGVGGYINDMLTEFYSIDWARAEELGYDASSNSGFSSAIKNIVCYFILSKGSAMGMNILVNTPFFFADSSLLSLIEAGGFCPIKIIDWGVEKVYNTFDDIIASFKGEYDFSGIFTRITKEEFYSFEA